jgi:hypothetical protein
MTDRSVHESKNTAANAAFAILWVMSTSKVNSIELQRISHKDSPCLAPPRKTGRLQANWLLFNDQTDREGCRAFSLALR